MAVATGVPVTVVKNLPAGIVTNYVDVSLYVDYNSVLTRYNTTITNATALTAGSITATGVTLSNSGVHVLVFSSESNADLDTNGVIITPLFSTSVTAVTVDTSITV